MCRSRLKVTRVHHAESNFLFVGFRRRAITEWRIWRIRIHVDVGVVVVILVFWCVDVIMVPIVVDKLGSEQLVMYIVGTRPRTPYRGTRGAPRASFGSSPRSAQVSVRHDRLLIARNTCSEQKTERRQAGSP
jgi:hypothetical protein